MHNKNAEKKEECRKSLAFKFSSFMISIINKFVKITESFRSFKYVHCTNSMKFHSIVLLIALAINFICYN